MKVLSFIIPAYNSQAFLEKCLNSLLGPDLLDKLEIIVVDDGSTDATAAIAGDFHARYPDTVRLIRQENKGHGGALNTGCAAARGTYLKVIDADDWVLTESLSRFVELLERCSSDVVLTHHHTIDIGTGEFKAWRSYPPEFGKAYGFDEIMASWKSFDRSLTFHGITYRTEFYRKHGIRLSEHVFYEDHEYAAYPCCLARTVTPFDLFVYMYRIGDVNQSVSDANRCRRIGHTAAVLDKMAAEYARIPPSPGRDYAAMKIQGLLLSYLTTALLAYPDRGEGRRLARARMEACRRTVPQAADLAKKQYLVFSAMNRLRLGSKTWERILRSRLYNRLRGNHSFT